MEAAARKLALEHLNASRDRLVGAVAGLADAQWTYRSAEDCWSIADCVEHLIVVEGRVFRSITRSLAAAAPEHWPDLRAKDQAVLESVPDRARRVKGPQAVMPTGRWLDQEELLQQFNLTREETIGFVGQTQADLRSRCFPHPFLGDLDCYQWLLFLGTHCERHVRQMEEVMADPGFPSLAVGAT